MEKIVAEETTFLLKRSTLPFLLLEGEAHHVSYANPAFYALAGCQEEQLLGKPFAEMLSEEESLNILASLDEVYRTGEAGRINDSKHQLAENSLAYWSYSFWPVFDEESHVVAVMMQVTDTTEAVEEHRRYEEATLRMREINEALLVSGIRQQELAEVAALAQERLFHAEKERTIGRLAGGIAHNFNNLLTIVLGYTELLQESVPDEGEAHVFLTHIKSTVERAAFLVRQLLAFARHQPIAQREVDINTLTQDTVEMLQPLIKKHIALSFVAGADTYAIHVDANQIEQVVFNLIINAVDAIPEEGAIRITTDLFTLLEGEARPHEELELGEYVLLTVTDTGTGMDANTREHIFEPFFTTKEVGKGTGMGLASCYGIVRQSGGQILVDSEPGQGTSFRIYLPYVRGDREVVP